MSTLSIGNTSTVIPAQLLEPGSAAGQKLEQKQAMQIGTLGTQLDTQVLMAKAKGTIATLTPAQLEQYKDMSSFNEADKQMAIMLFVGAVVTKEQAATEQTHRTVVAQSDPQADVMSFDPSAWEKHMGVLIAAIVAVNIARQASAEMSGIFTQLAYEAAQAQGAAIVSGGEAAMWAAVTGAVAASTMAIAGAGLSIRGQHQKHTDIKTNKADAAQFDKNAQSLRLDLKARPADAAPAGVKQVTGTNANGELETIQLQQGNGKLSVEDRTVLESQIREQVNLAKESRMKSALQEKTINRNLTLGGTLSSLATIMSSGLSAILRLQEYAERQSEVLHQSEQSLNKAVSDAATQGISENASLILKMLEAMQQLSDSRASTINAIASARA